MRYLDGSAAVEQGLGWQDLSGCRTFTSYLNSSHVGSSFKPLTLPETISEASKVYGWSSREGDVQWEMSAGCRSVVQPLTEASPSHKSCSPSRTRFSPPQPCAEGRDERAAFLRQGETKQCA